MGVNDLQGGTPRDPPGATWPAKRPLTGRAPRPYILGMEALMRTIPVEAALTRSEMSTDFGIWLPQRGEWLRFDRRIARFASLEAANAELAARGLDGRDWHGAKAYVAKLPW